MSKVIQTVKTLSKYVISGGKKVDILLTRRIYVGN